MRGSVYRVMTAWRSDPEFCATFAAELARAPYAAFRWETPAESAATAWCWTARARADRQAFAEHFRDDADVVTFPNLGRIAPGSPSCAWPRRLSGWLCGGPWETRWRPVLASVRFGSARPGLAWSGCTCAWTTGHAPYREAP